MKLVTVEIGHRSRTYLLFESDKLNVPLSLVKDERSRLLEEFASSDFYFDGTTGILAKVKNDKYRWRQRPFRWFFRDFIDKRFLFQFEARKEVRSKKIVQKAGLMTPDCVAWGISLNPFNHQGSLLLIEHVNGVKTGEQYFSSLEDSVRPAFLARLCDDIFKLAKAGYIHRDLHMNNFLCTPDGRIIWIDTHVKPLPRAARAKWRALYRSISSHSLLDEYNRKRIHTQLKRRWLAV
ncbi:lipopolysaccharide kinase InaA family protein [Halomonas sp. BC04]|uniref:lipopolysaccharide kinase InaA family protein n=1 Tax=Halomonas sp. BC04 TaxID=1403540 RepID=UPI0003ED6738|nr:lipopolysaccharide kinase InaA family protein [Halomonas sp. BC04]EWH02953.1 hypothetical protein Q427_05870 [Halomonas sp. BC04]